MLTVLSKYLLAGCAVIIVALGFLCYHYKLQAAAYQLQVAQITAGIDVLAEKQAVHASAVDQTAVVTKLTQANADLKTELEKINAINNAPKTADGSVAVVLSRALDGLRVAAPHN